ncbi:MAG: nitrate reductase [Gammaproteobacteria bacterium]|nr:nitrate reductase [Gammaproteobacteria bacterium]
MSACSNSVSTTCPYCGVGCGVHATHENDQVKISGDPDHPANFGKLCSKGYALADTLEDTQRLLSPRYEGKKVSWSFATTLIANRFSEVIEQYGPEAIAFYVSGQLLTEDYYVVNKFIKGFIGTANIDTNSRLCMASSVAGHKRAFGSDTVPGCYEDLESADLVILVGSNLAWCHPVLFQRIEKAKRDRPKMKTVVIDPRRTATAELADEHLAIAPGGESDLALFSGLLAYLIQQDAVDHEWIDANTQNFDAAAEAVQAWSVATVAEATGLPEAQIVRFYDQFLRTEKVVTVYSQGVNQSHRGTDTVNSIINTHLVTGRIGKPGCGPFSITGQPNAMGGREVGGLANMLTCHMDLENPEHRSLVQRYWQSPSMAEKPGLKAVDMFNAVADGQIKALWIMATNPVDSMPGADSIAEALTRCPLVIVSDVTDQTDTATYANMLLPARAWSEKNGTVTNSERRISRQRAFRKSPVLARSDWWAVSQVAKKMGYESAFDYQHASEIFKEFAGLSCYENKGTRDFNIGAFADINKAQYNDLQPFQWPKLTLQDSTSPIRFFSEGEFYTDNRKARFISVQPSDLGVTEKKLNARSEATSFICNTGRIRDQWHTMTRTGFSARLTSHIGEPFVEINVRDADILGLQDAVLVDVESESGCIRLRLLKSDRIRSGSVFIPMHWNDRYASNARINALVHTLTDPVSGQPALKNQRVHLKPVAIRCYGFMLTKEKPKDLSFAYWASAPVEQGWKTEFAAHQSAELTMISMVEQTEHRWAESGKASSTELLTYDDAQQSIFRSCWFDGCQLSKAVFLGPGPVSLSRQATCTLLTHSFDSQLDRFAVISGAGLVDKPDTGATVCSCLSVGSKTIRTAIENGCKSVKSVGIACGAGTQCGSCQADIYRLLESSSNETRTVAVA